MKLQESSQPQPKKQQPLSIGPSVNKSANIND